MKKKYTLCGYECTNEAALKMIKGCLDVFLNHNDNSYSNKKEIEELRYMVSDLKRRIENDRLRLIGIDFY